MSYKDNSFDPEQINYINITEVALYLFGKKAVS